MVENILWQSRCGGMGRRCNMPGKKAHKPRNVPSAGMHGVHPALGHGRKSTGQTEGQFGRDMKRRKGQFGGAGDSPLIKK